MRTGDVPSSTNYSIATILNCSTRNVYLDVQHQTDGSSCGLYALAFAQSYSLRRWWLFKSNVLSRLPPFSFWDLPLEFIAWDWACIVWTWTILEVTNPCFCLCWLPDSGDKMVMWSKCKQWYHIYIAHVLAFNLELDFLVDGAVLVVNYQTDTLPTDFFSLYSFSLTLLLFIIFYSLTVDYNYTLHLHLSSFHWPWRSNT